MSHPGRKAGGRDAAIVVVPAGGIGARLGTRLPKQYLAMAGAPVLVHTLRALTRAWSVAGVVVAAPADRVAATRALLARYRVTRVLAVVAGGGERQESVWEGLQASPPEIDWVVVHDGVRPFVTPALVERVLEAARASGAATCGMAVRETVKRVGEGTVEATVDRAGLWLVQTPQAFRRALLWEAHEKARRDGYTGTDDAVLVERLGGRVAMVPGLPENVKITTREDLAAARRWRRQGA
jgi:2-C-methyl-D-erythritol 4-phosphate cytidylyltransferase